MSRIVILCKHAETERVHLGADWSASGTGDIYVYPSAAEARALSEAFARTAEKIEAAQAAKPFYLTPEGRAQYERGRDEKMRARRIAGVAQP